MRASQGFAKVVKICKIRNDNKVFDQNLKMVEPGSDEIGTLARRGRMPVGYYNDPEKTARTFVEIKGDRRVITGDMAMVEADGQVTVSQGLTVSGNLDISDTIYHTGDSNTKIRFPSVDTISFHTSGNQQMSIGSDGKVTFTGDAKVGTSQSAGVILTSPDGTEYRLIVANGGALSTSAV